MPWEHVAATLPHLDRREARRAVLESLIRTHWLVGCRSSELLAMRPADLDRSADVWRYDVPRDARGHKNLHRTGRAGTYWVGPRCQKVLSTFLTDCPSDRPVFALPPLRKGAAWRTLDKDGYLRTIAKACKRAGVPHWSPHQLRHARATEVQRVYESDAAAAAALGDTPEVVLRFFFHADHCGTNPFGDKGFGPSIGFHSSTKGACLTFFADSL